MSDPLENPNDSPLPDGSESRARGTLMSLAGKAPKLDLGTPEILFLAALHLRAESAGLTYFSEAELIQAFRDVAPLASPAAEKIRKRATHAISRLRAQRLLVRVDGAGVVRSGEYALTRLGTAIVQFFLDDEILTRESLSLLTQSLISALGELVARVEHEKSPEAFNAAVIGPLRVTIADLAQGIERRQRALDLQQEDFQRQIAALIQADWFLALNRCQSLLEETGRTLRELNEVLLRDGHRLHEALQKLRDLAREAPAGEAEAAVERVSEQVDRIAAWGSARQRAWSEYHQYVHRFLRDVVRLDPTRALTERLRNQLGGKGARSFALTVSAEPNPLLLRDDVISVERAPVKRPRKERETEPEPTVIDDAQAELEAQVRRALEDGATGLAQITERVTAELPKAARYVSLGRVAEVVARLARAEPTRERPWLPVAEAFLVEEWPIEPGGVER